MEATLKMGAVSSKDHAMAGGAGSLDRGAQLPLNLVHEGQTVQVVKLHGGQETKQHLATLGFVEGAEVKVVSHAAPGVIVNVKGANIAIDETMARKITTR